MVQSPVSGDLMIRVFCTSKSTRDVFAAAAKKREYSIEFFDKIDAAELVEKLDETSLIVVDLTTSTATIESLFSTIDTEVNHEFPPVLYVLNSPNDIRRVAEHGNIVNQDFVFAPIEAKYLGPRLEVLKMLGDRRKLSLETAISDRLTGLYNRKYFLRRLEEEFYRAERYDYNVAALLASVEFEAVDGKLSETTGTEVIRKVADFLRGRLRNTDIIARYKWDDFAFLLPDINETDSRAVADDIWSKIASLDYSDISQDVKVSAYIGHALIPSRGLRTPLSVVEALEDCVFNAKAKHQHVEHYKVKE
jgi:diguanylate cyclase (GGDEF)-like protein